MAAVAVSVQSKEQTRGYNQKGTNPATRICSAFYLLNQQAQQPFDIYYILSEKPSPHSPASLFPPQASQQGSMAQGLRPLLGAKGWDCCILWRLSKDRRFLEWMGCCCGGAEETMEQVFPLGSPSTVAPPCRDMMVVHQRTWHCDALAELPSSIPLELDQPLGAHAQVLVSNQSMWMTFSDDSTTSHQRVRTRLMVPVPGGLVELFTSKQVNEDPNVPKLVLSLLNIPCELSSDKSMLYNSFSEGLAAANNEHGPYNYSGDEQGSDQVDDDDERTVVGRPGKRHPAKNLVAERNRRKKLNDRLYQLRSLVPNISKMDKASILVDAIEYVLELQKQVKVLQDELEEVNVKNREGERALFGGELDVMNGDTNGASHAMEDDDSSNSSRMVEHQMEPRVEVRQLDVDEFFVKVLCEHKHGGFTRLMEVISSLHLEVTNANVTKYQTLVLNVFTVKRKDYNELLQAEETIRDSLLELTRNRNAGDGIAGDYRRHELHHLNYFQPHQL